MLRRLRQKFFSSPALPAITEDAAREAFRIPVLCYHSWTFEGPDYHHNDHVALEADLQRLGQRGYEVLPVPGLLDLLAADTQTRESLAGRKLVCLTCDDGRNFDYYPGHNERAGWVPGFHDILLKSRAWLPQCLPGPRAVSFVIASPEARTLLDQACGEGKGEWSDDWWAACAEAGILGIANHSWDHVHDALPVVRQRDNRKGSFLAIDNPDDANRQIAEAQTYVNRKTGGRTVPVFGYPYGHVPPYLRDDYFPAHGAALGLRGAFSTDGRAVTEGDNIWDIPRFVCGFHWRSPEQFDALLDAVESGQAAP